MTTDLLHLLMGKWEKEHWEKEKMSKEK